MELYKIKAENLTTDINLLSGMSKLLHGVCTNVILYCYECAFLFARKNIVV
jgi:hypothetical protein